MEKYFERAKPVTLLKRFNRRLAILFGVFALITSFLIVIFYQSFTENLNTKDINETMKHMVPRLKDLDQRREENANHMLSIIDWSGIARMKEPLRTQKFNAFFIAQSENLGYEGLLITDSSSGKLIFNYWAHTESPHIQAALSGDQPIWVDEEHSVLYSRIKKTLSGPNMGFNVYFFSAWDSEILKRLSFPTTTTYISLGSHPLLSSAGNLSLEAIQPTSAEYVHFNINNVTFQESSFEWTKVKVQDGSDIPLRIIVRSPVTNSIPLHEVLAASFSLTLLFGLLIFFIFGRWLKQIGLRLNSLTGAVAQFQHGHDHRITDNTLESLQIANSGKHDQISVIAQELSNLMVSAEKRDEEQRAYIQTLDLLQDAVIEFSPTGTLLRATDAWKMLTGFDDIEQCGITNCVHPEDSAEVMEQISALTLKQKQQTSIRFRLRRQDLPADQYWVEGRFAAIVKDDKVVSIRGVVRDITASYLQERQISHMALHDALTDLPNRVLMEDRLEMSITRATRNGQQVALGFIDLDHFKQVNDNFGHKIGDRLLKEVTNRFQSALRSTDTLSRWGGDEFVVLCPDLSSIEDAREISIKLSQLTRENISIEGTEFPFTFSAGFALYPDDASNSDMLLSQADRAMFYAKAQGRNNVQFFNAIAAKEPGRTSFYIQSRLSTAIHNNEIQAWMQPLVSSQTGNVIGAEVLARWYEQEQGWIPPSVFIPMAESMGLIDILGQSVWQQALLAFPLLPNNHRLSVNLSKRQLFSSSIVEQFCNDIEIANIKPEQIMLEITEGIALSDVEFARERIVQLSAKGFGIAVDDFGVGYSSLAQLHEIPVDELKLDISFVKRIHNKLGYSMSNAIVSIAKSLNLECVAEGVEDARTADLLSKMGVDILQGYYFAKPMPISEYVDWLERNKLEN
jgi:diguanylate cyclase (GGDEF)-like protein/PAS domain S-box-containing protein